MRKTIAKFCKCEICALTKDSTLYTHSALQPLPITPACFYSYTLDFIINLPYAHGINCIPKVINHLTNFTILIPSKMGKENLLTA